MNEGIIISKMKPSGYMKIVDLEITVYGKLPNKFQRFMLKKVFGIEVIEYD